MNEFERVFERDWAIREPGRREADRQKPRAVGIFPQPEPVALQAKHARAGWNTTGHLRLVEIVRRRVHRFRMRADDGDASLRDNQAADHGERHARGGVRRQSHT